MKIAFITEVYPPETAKGGIGTYTKELAEELASRGHEVHVFSRGEQTSRKEINDVNVHRKSFSKIRRVVDMFRFSYWAARNIRENDFDIVEAPNYRSQGIFVPYLVNSKYVVRLSTPSFKDDEITMPPRRGLRKIESLIRYWLEKKATESADFVISNTESNLDLIKEKYSLPETKVIPHGLSEPELENKADQEAARILFVGRLDDRKNPEGLIRAIPHIENQIDQGFEVHFVGNKDEERKNYLLEELNQENSEKVFFHGFVEREKLNELYSKADVLVAPSIYESFGMIYIEAMSFGLPVVGSNRGGGQELIEAGFAVDPDDYQEIGRKVVKALNNKDKLSNRAREEFKDNYSIEKMTDRTINVYEDLLK